MLCRSRSCQLIWILLLAGLGSRSVRAVDFHIENSVYSGKEPKPVSRSSTIYRAGRVYDYLGDKTVAVFDRPGVRFLLLDPGRKIKTEISTEKLQRFCDDLQARVAVDGNAYLKFLARPHFDTSVDDKTGELVLKSTHLTYRVSMLPAESPDAVAQYREFSDWCVRLNAMTNHYPFAFTRMALSDELYNRGRIAGEVQLTVPAQTPNLGRSINLRSEHQVSWRLLKDDMDRVIETQHQITTFKSVGLEQFQQAPDLSKR